jgi:hypothetical protein
MDPAEHYEVGFGSLRRLLRKKEGVALEVGVFDYLFPLVVVPQNGNRGA